MNELGIICDIKDSKAKVAIGDMVTDFLNVFQMMSNSYAVSFSPLRVGEQVLVLPVRGDLNSGIILRGIYQNVHQPLNTDTKCYNICFEDGTQIMYDSSKSSLSVSVVDKIELSCKQAILNADTATTTCKQATLNAQSATINSPQINLNGNTTIAGSISTSGEGGSSGSFTIKGNMQLNGNLSVSGNISDSKGDLTNHTHSVTCGSTAVSR